MSAAGDSDQAKVVSQHELDDPKQAQGSGLGAWTDPTDGVRGAAPDDAERLGVDPGLRTAARPADAGPATDTGNSTSPDPDEQSSDALEGDPGQEVALTPREQIVVSAAEERAELRALSILEAVVQTSSGPLPIPSEFYEYREDHQERMMRMAEAPTTDESARRDRIVDARIAQSERAQWITPVMLFVCIAAALVAFGPLDSEAGGIAFLALPVVKFIGSYAITFSIGGRKKRD